MEMLDHVNHRVWLHFIPNTNKLRDTFVDLGQAYLEPKVGHCISTLYVDPRACGYFKRYPSKLELTAYNPGGPEPELVMPVQALLNYPVQEIKIST